MIALLKNNPAALSEMIRRLLAPHIARYGEMTALECDPASGKIACTLMLSGEREPIGVTLEGCGVTGGVFGAQNVRCSRVWLQTLLNDHPAWLRFPVSGEAAALLNALFSKKAHP